MKLYYKHLLKEGSLLYFIKEIPTRLLTKISKSAKKKWTVHYFTLPPFKKDEGVFKVTFLIDYVIVTSVISYASTTSKLSVFSSVQRIVVSKVSIGFFFFLIIIILLNVLSMYMYIWWVAHCCVIKQIKNIKV